jgi:hypothetical protein
MELLFDALVRRVGRPQADELKRALGWRAVEDNAALGAELEALIDIAAAAQHDDSTTTLLLRPGTSGTARSAASTALSVDAAGSSHALVQPRAWEPTLASLPPGSLSLDAIGVRLPELRSALAAEHASLLVAIDAAREDLLLQAALQRDDGGSSVVCSVRDEGDLLPLPADASAGPWLGRELLHIPPSETTLAAGVARAAMPDVGAARAAGCGATSSGKQPRGALVALGGGVASPSERPGLGGPAAEGGRRTSPLHVVSTQPQLPGRARRAATPRRLPPLAMPLASSAT